ncbi:MAG: 4-hydroxy-3-methylbut-2-enyl diphosphate reductase [Candidatus Eisenbacteria bacterium]|uniref:4-hydroxy-3-methylbut-2-enyl diphosphate reductase n=1 Tax=Eiseniibacteriota bacterium TaxID=2212470 RepID=A0A538SQN2_UNCEI|nr:MAG: 4-hydroxy-3-methylbut-2-enyl diphosphate reductase [Candidatus Eisenbacteria bacterium]TMQ66979.1 MAG: 4-hydroxy-3-methylbut-2-enyl diphosphate reductase [Candidatus Eisenbacteria bacterium]
MDVIVADNAGFCFGVKRAIKMANDTMDGAGMRVKSLGSLIHNPQVVNSFRERGLEVVEDLDSVDSEDTVIIRSHGVGPELRQDAAARGLKVVDTTCPFVTKAQQYAAKLIADGYKVVMIGDKDHPEVIGVVAHTQNRAIVINTVAEAEALKFIPRMGVVFQTTHSIGHVQEIVGALLKRGKEVRVFNTLCGATTSMQKTAIELSSEVEAMVIVGGRQSANTAQLAEVCRRVNPRVLQIESADEIREDWFQGLSRVGVSAGASTPDEVIADVVDRITRIEPSPAGA